MDTGLKSRAEQTIINLLKTDFVLASLVPQKQASGEQINTNPRLAVVCQIGQEYVIQGGIFRIPTTIEIWYNLPQIGQSPEAMEDAARRVDAVLTEAQADGRFGIIRMGGSTSLNGLTAKRTISVTLIAS